MKTRFIQIILFCTFFSTYGFAQTENYQIHWPPEFQPKRSHFFVHNQIEIAASPQVVWDLLINAGNWPTWYQGITQIQFEDSSTQMLQLNAKVFWKSMGQNLNNQIIEFIPFERLSWQFYEKDIQGCHAWLIIPTENGCYVITDESQNGKLARLQKIFLPNKLHKQHDNWLKVLKSEAEKVMQSTRSSAFSPAPQQELIQTLEASQEKFLLAIQNLNDIQLNFKPDAKQWSIRQCIQHITLAEADFIQIAQKAKGSTHPKSTISDQKIRPKMLSKKWRAKAPPIYQPKDSSSDIHQLIAEFNSHRLNNIYYAKEHYQILRSRYWKHPLTGTIDLHQTLLLMSAHLERHTAQIEAVKLHPKFPG